MEAPVLVIGALGNVGTQVVYGLQAAGRKVRAGEPIMRFDVLTGDQLFVDRLSHHFVRPKVGDGFFFRTPHIAGMFAKFWSARTALR